MFCSWDMECDVLWIDEWVKIEVLEGKYWGLRVVSD